MGVEYIKNATNRKEAQLEDFSRYFEFEQVDRSNLRVTKIYKEPLAGLDNGYFYKTMIIPVKCNSEDYKYLLQCREWAGQCWNALVKVDNEFYDNKKRFMNKGELQTFVKDITPLHASGNQYVYLKYFSARDAMFRSREAGHKNSNKVKLPYKQKKYFSVAWNVFCFRIDYNNKKLYLSRKRIRNGLNRPQVCCSFKTMPRYVVEIELIYRNGLYFAVKYKEPKVNNDIETNNVSAIDFGEIHSITSVDNNGNALIITGRKLRSVRRLYNKELGKLNSKRSKTIKDSRQYQKYSKAVQHLNLKKDNQIKDCVHKISKLYLDYCIQNGISKVYYGDLDSCTRGHHGEISRFVNQKLRDWCYGKLTEDLENKLGRYGIEMIKVSEAYTSQTCPHCGYRHKPKNRNYECKCGYKQHRDLVGAMNILNFNEKDLHIERYSNLKYLRIS